MDPKLSPDWNKYPSYVDLQTNSRISIIISVRSLYSDSVLNSLVRFLEDEGYQSKSKLVNGVVLSASIYKDNNMLGTIESHYVWLVGEISFLLYQHLLKLLKTDFGYHENTISVIYHKEMETVIEKSILIRFRSGIPKSSNSLVPYSACHLYYDDTLIGKALLEYYNPDTGEYEPTILLIEVSQEWQSYGVKILEFIENILQENGFTKLWALNIQNELFWKGVGYDINENHAIKYLKS